MLDNAQKFTKQEETLKIGSVALNDVKDAFSGVLNKKLHIQGSIPEHKLINAKKGMGISESISDILCIYDDCVILSPGDTGFAIVPKGNGHGRRETELMDTLFKGKETIPLLKSFSLVPAAAMGFRSIMPVRAATTGRQFRTRTAVSTRGTSTSIRTASAR